MARFRTGTEARCRPEGRPRRRPGNCGQSLPKQKLKLADCGERDPDLAIGLPHAAFIARLRAATHGSCSPGTT